MKINRTVGKIVARVSKMLFRMSGGVKQKVTLLDKGGGPHICIIPSTTYKILFFYLFFYSMIKKEESEIWFVQILILEHISSQWTKTQNNNKKTVARKSGHLRIGQISDIVRHTLIYRN